MSQKTSIAWTEATWNPVTGCTKTSLGCKNCYAETMAKRLQAMGSKRYANGFTLTLHPDALNEPKKVKKPSMFFVCSMADLFHEDVPFAFIDKVMEVIEATPQHTYQLLTKRVVRMYDYFNDHRCRHVPANAWLGTTIDVGNNNNNRISTLAMIRNAPVRFLSCEPLLDDLTASGRFVLDGIDWVIVGGESGPKARPMDKEWVRNIRRSCEEQGVPFFFKQWGTFGEDGVRRDKKANGCLLDGEVVQEWPRCVGEGSVK